MAIDDPPNELTEVISLTPAICANRRSSGAASDDAAVCGSTPGSCTPTEMVGKSTFGSGATGRKYDETAQDNNTPAASSDVPTGRRMNGSEMFMFRGAHAPPRAGDGALAIANC